MKLTDAQKRRIKAEEIFRQEVIRSFEKRSRMSRFLNSPLGLWVLSSIFLTGVISGSHSLYGFLEKRSKDQQLREDLAYEITTQCGEFIGAIKRAHNYQAYSLAYYAHLTRLPNCHLSRFKDATMDQLLWELRSLPGKGDKQTADNVTSIVYKKLWPIIWELSWHPDFLPESADKKAFDASLYKVLFEEIAQPLQGNAKQHGG